MLGGCLCYIPYFLIQECFNSPYGTSYFPAYAEPIPGDSTNALASAAKECNIFLIGGATDLIALKYYTKPI